MNIILFNFSWMAFNVFLAFVAVVFGWLFLYFKNRFLKIVCAFIWLLFIPNTIYLFTDLINLMTQWSQYNNFERIAFLFQYGSLELICVFTFVVSLYPFEKVVCRSKKLKQFVNIDTAVYLVNFVIGFGMTLGRVQRINSWDVFFAPHKVVIATIGILRSPSLIILTVLFSLFASFLYLLSRKHVLRAVNSYLFRVAA